MESYGVSGVSVFAGMSKLKDESKRSDWDLTSNCWHHAGAEGWRVEE